MKVQLKFLAAGLFLLTAVMFTSCKKDGETESATTVKQDKDNIQASFDAIKANLTQFKAGSFYQAGIEFLNVKNGEALDDDWADQLGSRFGDIVDDENIISSNRFNYSLLAGKYTWNSGSKTWSRTSSSNFIALFPASKTSATNNCELGIKAYTDKSVSIEGETIYFPTTANAYLKKDNTQIMSFDFSASYNSNGFPTAANAELYLKPVTTSVSLSRKTDTKYNFTFSVVNENNKENALSIQSDVSFSNGITNYTDFDDVQANTIQLALNQGKLSINGTMDLKTFNELEDSRSDITASDINKTINLEVLYNDQKIGTLKVEEVGDDFALFLVYKDGTEENTSIYYNSFVSDIESIFKSDLNVNSIKSVLKNQVVKAKVQKLKSKVLFWKK